MQILMIITLYREPRSFLESISYGTEWWRRCAFRWVAFFVYKIFAITYFFNLAPTTGNLNPTIDIVIDLN